MKKKGPQDDIKTWLTLSVEILCLLMIAHSYSFNSLNIIINWI